MIQTRVEYTSTALANAEDFCDTYATIAFALFRQSFNKARPDILRKLKVEPPRRYWEKSDFVSDASRRAFFAKTGGGAYQRTGKYRNAWAVVLEQTPDGGAIKTRNDVPYAKWVGGSFSRSQDFQQPGHKRTGWVNARNVMDEANREIIADFAQRRNKYLDERFGVSVGTRNR